MFRYLPWAREGLFVFLRLVLAVGLMEGVRSGYFAGLLPFYAPEHLGLGPAAFTLAFTFHQLSENLSKTFGGLLAERVGFGKTVSLAAFAGFLTLLLTPMAHAAWLLWVLAVLWGLSMSTLYPGLMTLASRIAVPGREARALSFTLTLVMPWVGIGLVGVGQVAQKEPEAALTLLMVAQGVVLLLALSLFPFRIPIPKAVREPYPYKRLLFFLPAAFGQTFAPALVSLFILRLAKEELALEPIALGGLLLLGGALALGLLPLTGRQVDRKGYRFALVGGLFLLGVVMVWLAFTPSFMELILLVLLAGVGYSLFLPGWNGFLAKNLPQENRAAIWGGLMTVEGLGIALGPAVGGLLWEAFGLRAPLLTGSAVFFLLSLFYAVLFWRMRWS
ncbi:arabinose ABC transporter permease [Thermus scotoductus]|uniref:Arabinose ABC transporter permease n=1 Tax=Thermus scotoductus TaxID=37636 RepID=A0ABY0AGQ6_THESC|nr:MULTISPECIES: MFS transporter [Thermus]RTH17961.1 arabinose ABC transporter permease [Thermus scotoductus]RTI06236.1 arabinose ABC transporter permease [Thermus scotoductus]RTI26057.1 arabinose ABC transporter permease [Thermus scotoductus]ULR39820.1 MFS transporter [Thermus sp. NEB1569]